MKSAGEERFPADFAVKCDVEGRSLAVPGILACGLFLRVRLCCFEAGDDLVSTSRRSR